jgi:biotin--protein ligase
MALAAVEALKHFIPSIPAFLKWPNDIIVSADKNPAKFDKIGGILVNTSFHEGNPRLIVGLGVNLSNKDGPKSVAQVADELNLQGSVPSRMLFIEEVLKRFEKLYVQLEHGDKSEFVESYYRHWIHGNQVVRISKDVANLTPVIEDNSDHDEFITATIIGINDLGFLIAKRNDGIIYELQPGGNSFDLTRGMICKKLG